MTNIDFKITRELIEPFLRELRYMHRKKIINNEEYKEKVYQLINLLENEKNHD